MADVSAGHGAGLPLTGERTVPGVAHENYWFRRHEVAYEAVVGLCRGAAVLEAGCGEGYGAQLLGAAATTVIGVDYDAATVEHVRRRYDRVAPVRANLVALPMRAAVVDVVVSMQVIEHLWDQRSFLAECARVLRPGGTIVVTTPNRLTFSPGLDAPVNPFHTRELSAAELVELVAGAGLTVERVDGVHHGPRLRELDARHGGSIVAAQVAAVTSGEPWPAALVSDVASITTADFEIGAADVDASLDLLVVARA